jgi:hypothetical protein
VPAEELLAALGTDATLGLSDAEAGLRRGRYGPNELAEAPPEPRWRRLLGQFTELDWSTVCSTS